MLPESLKKIISILSKLPQIGPRQATRLAFWLIRNGNLQEYSDALAELQNSVAICGECFFPFDSTQTHTDKQHRLTRTNNTDSHGQKQDDNQRLCPICRDSGRDNSILCVVEKETDLLSLEKVGAYNGKYFILGGLLSGMNSDIDKHARIGLLLEKMRKDGASYFQIQEIILGLSPTREGELTAMAISDALRGFPAKITRLARGLPTGSELEFTDEETLRHAIEARK